MRSEYDEFVELNSLPVQDIADITFYSAAEYQPIKLETGIVANSLAGCLKN